MKIKVKDGRVEQGEKPSNIKEYWYLVYFDIIADLTISYTLTSAVKLLPSVNISK